LHWLTVVILTALIAGAALSHEGATGIVAERMTAMKNIGRELKAIGEMLVGVVPFDAAVVAQHVDALHEDCHRAATLFPPGSLDHHSRASPAIWDRPEEFAEEMQRLHHATKNLVATAAFGDKAQLLASFEVVQDACNSCHKTFRLPDN
jgi:cytochrome c556